MSEGIQRRNTPQLPASRQSFQEDVERKEDVEILFDQNISYIQKHDLAELALAS